MGHQQKYNNVEDSNNNHFFVDNNIDDNLNNKVASNKVTNNKENDGEDSIKHGLVYFETLYDLKKEMLDYCKKNCVTMLNILTEEGFDHFIYEQINRNNI